MFSMVCSSFFISEITAVIVVIIIIIVIIIIKHKTHNTEISHSVQFVDPVRDIMETEKLQLESGQTNSFALNQSVHFTNCSPNSLFLLLSSTAFMPFIQHASPFQPYQYPNPEFCPNMHIQRTRGAPRGLTL